MTIIFKDPDVEANELPSLFKLCENSDGKARLETDSNGKLSFICEVKTSGAGGGGTGGGTGGSGTGGGGTGSGTGGTVGPTPTGPGTIINVTADADPPAFSGAEVGSVDASSLIMTMPSFSPVPVYFFI